MKRLVSMILAVAVIISSAPTAVFAHDEVGDQKEIANTSSIQVAESNSEEEIWDGSIATEFAGGSGTVEDPYLISNGAELAFLAQEINEGSGNKYRHKHFLLTNDIYLNDVSDENWLEKSCNAWTPIGKATEQSIKFQGNFDGNGCTVYGVYINNNENYQGLFGCIYNYWLCHNKWLIFDEK